MTMRLAPLAAVRAAIAQCWLEHADNGSPTDGLGSQVRIGSIVLHPHQIEALRQLTDLLDMHGGAVLADAVGMGKTYVALAAASGKRHVLVVCPAVLGDVWQRSGRLAGVAVDTLSMERLSRGPSSRHVGAAFMPPTPRPDLVIVDEAHHFRNAHTRRYRALARLTAGAPVLLLTATPIHNRAGDLASILSLFLGLRAWTLTDVERSRYVVRRGHDVTHGLQASPANPTANACASSTSILARPIPRIVGPETIHVADDQRTLEMIVALPPPVPPRDGDVSAALTAMGLIRQWASSVGALRAALRRRLARAAALEASLENGAYPTYRDLREWCVGDGAIQLALPDLLVSSEQEDTRDATCSRSIPVLLTSVHEHARAVRELLRRLDDIPDIDAERATALRTIMRAHPHTRIVGFSGFEDTVHALFRELRRDGAVCAQSARGGMIAGGQMRRAEVLRQFRPGTSDRVSPAERIQLLLTTDLLSEGVDLQAAAVVVHLDLPWTPARLEQRVGRIARLGSPHEAVHVYALAPPAGSEALLGVEERLRAKLDVAGRAVGIAGSIVPRISASCPAAAEDGKKVGHPERVAMVREIVSRWRQSSGTPRGPDETLWAIATGPSRGFIAACVASGRPILLASVGAGVSDAPAVLAAVAEAADGARIVTEGTSCDDTVAAIHAWWAERCVVEDVGLSTITGAASRHRVLRRIAAISRRSPVHARPTMLALGERARRAVTARFGAGAEWVLDQLAVAPLPDAQWLRAVAAFGDANAVGRGPSTLSREISVRAMIVFEGWDAGR